MSVAQVGNVTLVGNPGENGTAPVFPPVIGPDLDSDTVSEAFLAV